MMKWMLFSLLLPQDVGCHHLQMPCKWSSWPWPICHLCSHEYSTRELPSGFHGSCWKCGGLCFTTEIRVQRKKLSIFCSHQGQSISCCVLCVKFSHSLYTFFVRVVLSEMLRTQCELGRRQRRWKQLLPPQDLKILHDLAQYADAEFLVF